ncbi:MAG: TraB/GumN family protein [Planktotalea sp.]
MVVGAFLALTLTNAAQAACDGTDQRKSLTAGEREQLSDTVANIPFASGNHWRATRNSKVIHLIGTIHLSDARLGPITERLQGVVESSQALLLEMSPKEEEALKADMASRPELLFLQDQTLPELMEEADWQELSEAVHERGVPPMLASRFQPWYLSMMLAIPPCLTAELHAEGNKGLDHRLRDIALAAGVPMQGMEPHDTLFRLFNDEPLAKQIDLMLLSLETADQSLDQLATVKAAYYEQNHAEAWEMSRRAVMQIEGRSQDELRALFSEWEEDLLILRNQAWIPVILEALDGNRQITVAAGAGHLGGAKGILALLKAEGFSLERLPF